MEAIAKSQKIKSRNQTNRTNYTLSLFNKYLIDFDTDMIS